MAQATPNPKTTETKTSQTAKVSPQPKAPSLNAEKLKTLETAISSIEKQFGKGSIMRLGENKSLIPQTEVVPTGSLTVIS